MNLARRSGENEVYEKAEAIAAEFVRDLWSFSQGDCRKQRSRCECASSLHPEIFIKKRRSSTAPRVVCASSARFGSAADYDV
jgi:hypothetical protein